MKAGKTSSYYGVSLMNARSGAKCMMDWHEAHPWGASIRFKGTHLHKAFATEREAAICVDRWILEYKLDKPLNILKPTQR